MTSYQQETRLECGQTGSGNPAPVAVVPGCVLERRWCQRQWPVFSRYRTWVDGDTTKAEVQLLFGAIMTR